jgi:hypothetical protein
VIKLAASIMMVVVFAAAWWWNRQPWWVALSGRTSRFHTSHLHDYHAKCTEDCAHLGGRRLCLLLKTWLPSPPVWLRSRLARYRPQFHILATPECGVDSRLSLRPTDPGLADCSWVFASEQCLKIHFTLNYHPFEVGVFRRKR